MSRKRKSNLSPQPQSQDSASADRTTARSGTSERKRRLLELITMVLDTAKAKGWRAWKTADDAKNYRYATVSVSRQAPGTFQDVTGTFEISCDERVKISYHKTSFHDWGLSDLQDAIGNELRKLSWIKRDDSAAPQSTSELALLERLLRRFHRVARQLKQRHDDRTIFSIQDEYDVQDLLHAILRGLFDDIRAEEHAPSYAGGGSRMDFLLKSEKIVLETKVASSSLRDKQIGEELIVDIKRYQAHPDCRRLMCFVYDPLGNLKNPSGLEADLSGTHDKLEVKVIVVSP